MAERILALGISGLPNPIKCFSWKEIEDGLRKQQRVNITDYNIVFIDFSYIYQNTDKYYLIQFCLNEIKFFEAVKSGIDLYILGVPHVHYDKPLLNPFAWLPSILTIHTIVEPGETVNCFNKSFTEYFNLLKNWFFYYYIKQDVSDKYPYLYDIKELAVNNAGQKLGVEISNFRRINTTNLAVAAMGLKMDYVEATYKGKLYILHTLNDNSGNGIISILKNIYNLSFPKQKPTWCNYIQTKKLSIIGNEIQKLFEDKQKIESEISQKFCELEKIEYYKQLLWQIREELEDVVHASLRLIELFPSAPTKADDDGIFNCNNEEYMLEIKSGLEHGATFGELSKLITRIESRKKLNKKDCKGIFIMNHFANFPLKDRDKPFPKNVIDTAKVNNVKLITTEQLFNIIKQILDGEINAADAQKQFFSL